MKRYLQAKVSNQLVLDNRLEQSLEKLPRIILQVFDKHDPDTWQMVYQNTEIDSIAAVWDSSGSRKPVSVLIEVKSAVDDQQFSFAKAFSHKRQQFDGLLFMTGNSTLKRLQGFHSQLLAENLLEFNVIPSVFWSHSPNNKPLKNDGNKLGFRFMVRDANDDIFYSNDPILIGRDWVRH
ncbi:hypothetical protein [Shewanella marina]|uniref:hypothetical protein n=1 Tax=Shewanella marina TaxID=487319 RepID=UPI00046FD1F8|nr:hypothetical protein [Shewanella marina]